MKKIFEKIGILALLIGSFIYTNKTIEVVNNQDDIMIEIKKNYQNYEKELIETENNNGLIIGINGLEVDIDKSYNKMKKIGYYDEKLYEYNKINKNIKNTDYIIGSKKNISLIFKIYNNDDLKSIINILDKNNIQANIFIDYDYFVNNSSYILSKIPRYTIGNLGLNNNYNKNEYNILSTIIKNVGNQKYGFCYTEEDKKEIFNICKSNNDYTIKPSIIIENYPYIEFKKQIKEGSIISFEVNKKTIEELQLIINYINTRDLKTIDLVNLLDM